MSVLGGSTEGQPYKKQALCKQLKNVKHRYTSTVLEKIQQTKTFRNRYLIQE